MKKKQFNLLIKVFFCFLFIASFSKELVAQTTTDSTMLWSVKTKDGNTYYGVIIDSNEEEIQLKTEKLGILTLKEADIKRKLVVKDYMVVDGEIWPRNRMANRMMLSPTGILQKQEEGYYENKYLFINHINLPLGDGFSLGMGMIPLFVFNEAGTPAWLTTKIRIPVKLENLHITVGTFASTILFNGDTDGNYLIGYSMATYGNENLNVTFGLGYGYGEYGWFEKASLAYGATMRVSKRSFLFIEQILAKRGKVDYYYEVRSLLTFGARTNWRKVSLDYGVFQPKDGYNDTFMIIPYVGVVFPLSR